MFKIITPRTCAEEVPEQWDEKYGPNGTVRKGPQIQWPEKGKRTPKEVHRLICESLGKSDHQDWCHNIPTCSNCGDSTKWVVQVGEPPEYESKTVWLCKKCTSNLYHFLSSQGNT